MKLAVIQAFKYREEGPFKRLLKGCLQRAGVPAWGINCEAEFFEPGEVVPPGVPTLLLGKDVAKLESGYDFQGKGREIHSIRGSLLPRRGGGWHTLTVPPELVSM